MTGTPRHFSQLLITLYTCTAKASSSLLAWLKPQIGVSCTAADHVNGFPWPAGKFSKSALRPKAAALLEAKRCRPTKSRPGERPCRLVVHCLHMRTTCACKGKGKPRAWQVARFKELLQPSTSSCSTSCSQAGLLVS